MQRGKRGQKAEGNEQEGSLGGPAEGTHRGESFKFLTYLM